MTESLETVKAQLVGTGTRTEIRVLLKRDGVPYGEASMWVSDDFAEDGPAMAEMMRRLAGLAHEASR